MHPRSVARRRATLAASPVSCFAGVLALGIATAVLAAWMAKAGGVTGLAHWIYRMNPMTAVCLALSGAALCLSRRALPSTAGAARLALGLVIAGVGAVKLSQLAMGQPAGIDLVLFTREVRSASRQSMAPNTAIAFTLLGASLALASVRRRRTVSASQVLAGGSLAVATAGLIAYAYGAINLIEFPGPSTMALHTAVGLTAASVGVLWVHPRQAVTGLLTNRTLGGAMARSLLPALVLITFGLGGVRVEMARRGMLNEVNGIAMLVVAVLIALIVVVLILARNLRDVSRRLAARERALRSTAAELEAARDVAASAAKARADFIANVSHEIRNPLTAILGYAGRLNGREDLDPAARTAASRINSAAQALHSVVNDVLDFSKLEAGQIAIRPSLADPAALVAEAASLFEQQAVAKKLRLSVEVRSGLPRRLLIDPDRVRQILLNLIGNAIKFTEAGMVQVVAGYDAASGRLRVAVEDTGSGISAEQRELLFQRFSQIGEAPAHLFGGAGLGLAICKGLVEAMNGEIGVDSRPGGGSIFYISLPASTAPGEATAAEKNEDARR
jgi:signal transduction histidine kinase